MSTHPTVTYYNVSLGAWRACCVCGWEMYEATEEAASKDAMWHRSRTAA